MLAQSTTPDVADRGVLSHLLDDAGRRPALGISQFPRARRAVRRFTRRSVADQCRPSLYLRPWLVTLFAQHLPLDCATRLFDIFVLEGDSSAFRIALALLRALEARLFNPDRAELEAMFRGEDRGARAIAARERGVPESEVSIDDVYVRLTGGGEDALFEALAAQEWREKTWARLVERELPE